jgi:DNA-binding NarL/FixJ family response regulator
VLADAPDLGVLAETQTGPRVLALVHALSRHENQVFCLLTAGQTVSEIGAQLQLASTP